MFPQNNNYNATNRGKNTRRSKKNKSFERSVEIHDPVVTPNEIGNGVTRLDDTDERGRDRSRCGCFSLFGFGVRRRRRRPCQTPVSDRGYESGLSESSTVKTPITCEENSNLGSPQTSGHNHLSKQCDDFDKKSKTIIHSLASESEGSTLVNITSRVTVNSSPDLTTQLTKEEAQTNSWIEINSNENSGNLVNTDNQIFFVTFSPPDDETAMVEGLLDELSNQSSIMSFDPDEFSEDDNEQNSYHEQEENYLDLTTINEGSDEETEI